MIVRLRANPNYRCSRKILTLATCYAGPNGWVRPEAAIRANVTMCEFFLLAICYSLLLFIMTSP